MKNKYKHAKLGSKWRMTPEELERAEEYYGFSRIRSPVTKKDVASIAKDNKAFSPMFYAKIQSVREAIKITRTNKEYFNVRLSECKDSEEPLILAFRDLVEEDLEKLNRELAKWKRLRNMALGKKPIFSKRIDIDQVKEYPIENLLETAGNSYGHRVKYNCPIHNEKTASFVHYKDQNTWWCYGCSQGGSVIDLYMGIYKVEFKDALHALNQMN